MPERVLTVATLIGSLRRGSMSRWLFHAALELAPPGLRLVEAPVAGLPHYNEDLDVGGGPPPVRAVREQIAGADGVLFVTPACNYSIPGVLTHALSLRSETRADQSIR